MSRKYVPRSHSLVRFYYGLLCLLFSSLWFSPTTVLAQTPFNTDDADVADKGKFHLDITNEHDLLQRSAFPNLRQNTTLFSLVYGLGKHVEIGVDAPLIAIYRAQGTDPRRSFGYADTNFHVKYNFYREREDSRMPALTASFYVEAPTGNPRNSLGSGVTTYWLYGVAQKSVTKKTKVRLNSGILFAGNTLTGVIGIRTTRGRVFTGAASVVKEFTPKLKLGAELTGAVTGDFQLSKGQLQTLWGGNYALRKNLTFDFGLVGGRFAASPRAGAQLGFSFDF